MRYVIALTLLASLAGCGTRPAFFDRFDRDRAPQEPAIFVDPNQQLGAPTPLVPPEGEQLASTTVEPPAPQTPTAAGPGALGSTIASLGDPAEEGFWLKTPLVSSQTAGRVVYGKTGRSVNVELRASGTAPGTGSQISLSAMRLLDAPLTDLIEVDVFRN